MKWCTEAGGGITIRQISKDPKASITKTDDGNPFWVAFQNAVNEL